jgi:hypothetical protein
VRRSSKPRKSATTTLEREEWFFGKVPEDEIVTCFYYEYARSREDIRQLVYSWHEKLAALDQAHADKFGERLSREWRWTEEFPSREDAIRTFWSELAQLTDWTCSQLLINVPEFPDVPWQKIRPSKRAKWKRLLTFTRDRYPDGILGGLWPETNQNTVNAIRYDQMRTSLGELVPFSIDWRGGIEKVISDFKKWARKHYSELDLPRKKKPRDTYYESLKQLGVLRLKDKLGSWNAVQNYTRSVLGSQFGKLYGDDHTLWRKARLAAIKRRREMFPITFPTSLMH